MSTATREPPARAASLLERALHAMSSPFLSRQVLLADRRVYATAGELDLVAEPLRAVRDGSVELRGAVYRARAAGEPAPPLVVFFPGSTGNLSAHLPYVELAARAGCEVACCDYTGFGASDGEPDLRSLVRDAHAILDAALELRARAPVSASRTLGVFGVSLGSNIALALAASRPEIDAVACEGLSRQRDFMHGVFRDGAPGPRRLRGIALDGDRLPDRERVGVTAVRAPARLAGGLAALAEAVYPFEAKDPLEIARRVRGPRVLLVHGTHDTVLPIETTLDVLALLPRAAFWPIAGVGHAQEPAFASHTEYESQLRGLFTPPGTASAGPDRTLVSVLDGDVLRVETRPLDAPDSPALGTVIGSCRIAGNRDAPSPREAAWTSTWREVTIALRTALRSGDLELAAARVAELAATRVESPFDILLRLYAARVEDLAARRNDRARRTAREAFERLGGRSGEASDAT